MNKLFAPFCLALSLLAAGCGQASHKNTATPADTALVYTHPKPDYTHQPPDTIATIRGQVAHINTTQLQKKHVEFMCDEEMMVDYFYENGELVKIAVDFGTVGDAYAKEGYYYHKGNLIFKYEYVEGGPACEGCITKNEYRSYISDGKVVKYLKNNITQACRTCTFALTSKEYKLLKTQTADEAKAVLCR